MSTRLRYALIVLPLAIAAGFAAWLRAAPAAAPAPPAQSPASLHAYHIDIAGWYAATGHETVVYASYPLAMSQVAQELPTTLAAWQSTELGTDDDIETWFDHPDLVMRRQYTTSQHLVWLTAIGSQGAKSFHIFEHTPASCYPSADWIAVEHAVYRVPLPGGSMPVNRALYHKDGITRLVYYWYQWDSPTRDAREGVTSWRITTDIVSDITEADALLASFLGLIYQESIAWRRF